MKKINLIGKVIVAIGVLQAFRKVDGYNGFGGYIDNTCEILTISLILCVIGAIMILISKRSLN